MVSLIATFRLINLVPLIGTLFVFFFFVKDLGIVQCFVFLDFLSLLENFGLATPIIVGIRVLGVETPLRT